MELADQNQTIDLNKLYHYSTPGGFNGIIKSKSIWMTNILYQNDIEEYNYAIKLALDVITNEYKDIPYFNLHPSIYLPPIYTFSFTEEADLLSQWRGYSSNGGFSFSFRNELLQEFIQKHGLKLVKCEYDVDKQKEIIRKAIGRSPEQQNQSKAKEQEAERKFRETYPSRGFSRRDTTEGNESYYFERRLRILNSIIASHASYFKHPKFAEEKEWRLIMDGTQLTNFSVEIKYREAKDIIIPYIEIPLTENDEKLKFSSIIVGPGTRQNLARMACQQIPHESLSESQIPYRN